MSSIQAALKHFFLFFIYVTSLLAEIIENIFSRIIVSKKCSAKTERNCEEKKSIIKLEEKSTNRNGIRAWNAK